MSEQERSLLVIRSQKVLTRQQLECMSHMTERLKAETGLSVVVADGGLDVGIHSDIGPLIEEQLLEQRKTNQLLLMLIEALGGDEQSDETEPTTYMDGTPVAK